MTLIAYYSKTGNTRRFVDKLDQSAVEITPGLTLEQPFVLVTPTYNFGQVPEEVVEFIKFNHTNMLGVVGTGNIVWAQNFAKSADIISRQFSVPIIRKIELSGTAQDVGYVKKWVEDC